MVVVVGAADGGRVVIVPLTAGKKAQPNIENREGKAPLTAAKILHQALLRSTSGRYLLLSSIVPTTIELPFSFLFEKLGCVTSRKWWLRYSLSNPFEYDFGMFS